MIQPGIIVCIRIFDRAKSPAEVADKYRIPLKAAVRALKRRSWDVKLRGRSGKKR